MIRIKNSAGGRSRSSSLHQYGTGRARVGERRVNRIWEHADKYIGALSVINNEIVGLQTERISFYES